MPHCLGRWTGGDEWEQYITRKEGRGKVQEGKEKSSKENENKRGEVTRMNKEKRESDVLERKKIEGGGRAEEKK